MIIYIIKRLGCWRRHSLFCCLIESAKEKNYRNYCTVAYLQLGIWFGKQKKNWPTIEADFKSRLEERIANLETRFDSGRLEQEVVLLLSKADIREEIDRLLLHLDETERVLTMDGAIGRRLDFLMQELNREANTMAAKSAHPKMTTSSVDLKVLIEQMREQVQNVE